MHGIDSVRPGQPNMLPTETLQSDGRFLLPIGSFREATDDPTGANSVLFEGAEVIDKFIYHYSLINDGQGNPLYEHYALDSINDNDSGGIKRQKQLNLTYGPDRKLRMISVVSSYMGQPNIVAELGKVLNCQEDFGVDKMLDIEQVNLPIAIQIAQENLNNIMKLLPRELLDALSSVEYLSETDMELIRDYFKAHFFDLPK